ncbi:ASCH domain protein [Caulifigura coniformis]|uniref:ASCH domain protein n=1 Tax=Caulifigura coniformis TaxID=2527983 RepID=A0A517SGC3_9PLAN|nr:ASCH domain-containing protein [Caulifigura coniformis]QDT55171.1 ASCH domain protein [Caulifigura coniformis]
MEHPDKELIALGVRQPWAELILRGIKTIEVRSLPTNVRGPIYLYSSKKLAETPAAEAAAARHGIETIALPRGLLVGTIDIVGCESCRPSDAEAACLTPQIIAGKLGWRLEKPHRLATPLPVRFLPYGVWFYPFRRKGG